MGTISSSSCKKTGKAHGSRRFTTWELVLIALLAASGISADDTGSIAIVSLVQYHVELPIEEALRPGNLYLASTQDDAALSEEDGPYLLVIREDALSTRWVRQVVRLEVCG